jgi:hypothetical protein
MFNLIRAIQLMLVVLASVAFQPITVHAQHLFAQKLDDCNTTAFCLDCGEPKATCDTASFNQIADKINRRYNLKGASGAVMFQVLVDSLGHGCTLSYTDPGKSPLSQEIIAGLNACKWFPALEKGKPTTSSINILFKVANDHINGSIQRVDNESLNANMSNPGEVKIYNNSYRYTNKDLPSYQFEIWQKKNSALPQDMSQHSVVRNDEDVWYATLDGLARFQNGVFRPVNESNSPFKSNQDINAMALDKDGNVWLSTMNGMYKFDGTTFAKQDPAQIGVKSAYHIIPTDSGELLLCDDKGLFIYKAGKYKTINQANEALLPSNRVYYAYQDSQHRLWIGTFSGSIMIDNQHKVTAFNRSETPLKVSVSLALLKTKMAMSTSVYMIIHLAKSGTALVKELLNWIEMANGHITTITTRAFRPIRSTLFTMTTLKS